MKNLSKEQLLDEKLFENNDFLQSLLGTINQNSFLDLESNLENIKAFPIFVSEKLEIINKKNIFFIFSHGIGLEEMKLKIHLIKSENYLKN